MSMLRLPCVALVTLLLAACGPQVVNAVSEGAGRGGTSTSPSGGGGHGGSAAGTSGAGGDPRPPTGKGALVHRYSFDGPQGSIEAVDSISGADGVVINTTLTGTGEVELAGGSSNEYIDLPRFIVSRLESATFEAWVTWNGDPGDWRWQRIFDFGEDGATGNELGPDERSSYGRHYLFLTPQALYGGRLRAAYLKFENSQAEQWVDGPSSLPTNELTQVVVVVDPSREALELYVNGALVGAWDEPDVPFTGTLAELYDVNNWLGRSNFGPDAFFWGTYHEFRIYSFALSDAQIAENFQAGPNEPAIP